MKIAFISQPLDTVLPPHQNSIGLWIYEVARRLARSCEVIVYTRGSRFRRKVEYGEGVHYRGIPMGPDRLLLRLLRRFSGLRNVKRPAFASSLYYLGYILQVANDLRAQQCDVVHLFNFSQFVPVIRAFNPNMKIVLHMQCEWLTQLDRAMIERRLSEADLVIGCSEYITEKIRRRFPQFANRYQTVFNGVDVNQFLSENGHSTAKKNGVKRLLFVGRVSPEKGVHVLLDAFQKVVERYPQAQLEIVGSQQQLPFEFLIALSDDDKVCDLTSFYYLDGVLRHNYFSSLQEQLLLSNIAAHVTFLGSVPHMHVINHYRDADVFIFPSVWDEPFGIPLVEAMACQVPVVATRSGGMTEVVEEGKTGLLVERGDAPALAEAILRLLSNKDLRRAMGKAGRRRVLDLFSWEQVVKKVLCQYQNICEKRLDKAVPVN